MGGGRLIDASSDYSLDREAMVIKGHLKPPLPEVNAVQYFDIYLDGFFFYRTPANINDWGIPNTFGEVTIQFAIELKGKTAKDGRQGL